MSNLSQFAVSRPTKSITNRCSGGGVSSPASCIEGRAILSGALTSGTLKTLLSVAGAGEFAFLGAYSVDTTSRTIRLRVTLDGTVVFDSTTSAVTTASAGNLAVGSPLVGSTAATTAPPVRFNRTAVVEVASSLSETDKVGLSYILYGA